MRGGPVAVSVVVPAFNAESFLADAVKRLLAQTEPVEIVLVDDGSIDGTPSIARALAEEHESVTFIGLGTNGGVAAARRAGVAAASGRYIWFVDADDDWSTSAVEVMLAAAEAADADVVCAGAEYRAADGSTRPVPHPAAGTTLDGEGAFRALLMGRITGHLWNKLFSARLFPSIDFTAARVHSDQAMVAQLLATAASVVAIDDVVYAYRLRAGSIIRSGSRRAESLETVASVVRACAEKLGPEVVDSAELAYYTARFSLLSRVKDATSGAYSEAESRQLVRRARSEMSPAVVLSLARARDARRFVLLCAARTSTPAYRLIMRARGARE